MSWEGMVEAVSAGVTGAAVVGAALRSYWTRRETRQQAAFKRAVQQVVDESIAAVIARQVAFEKRQGRHLDRQDETLRRLRVLIEKLGSPSGAG